MYDTGNRSITAHKPAARSIVLSKCSLVCRDCERVDANVEFAVNAMSTLRHLWHSAIGVVAAAFPVACHTLLLQLEECVLVQEVS